MELFQSELRYFCALKLTQPYIMKQLEGKTEYAKAKHLLALMQQDALTAGELIQIVPMRESFITNFYNVARREAENNAFCNRQSLDATVKMVLILRDAACDANVLPRERLRIFNTLTEVADMLADADIRHVKHTYKMRKAAGVVSLLSLAGVIFLYQRDC